MRTEWARPRRALIAGAAMAGLAIAVSEGVLAKSQSSHMPVAVEVVRSCKATMKSNSKGTNLRVDCDKDKREEKNARSKPENGARLDAKAFLNTVNF